MGSTPVRIGDVVSNPNLQSNFEKLCPRQLQESAKAYAVCQDYCFMGTARSLDKLVTLYLEKRPQSAPKAPPTKRIKTIKRWSSSFDWSDRANRWDGYEMAIEEQQLAQARQEWLPSRIEAQKNWLDRADRLRAIADKLLDIFEAVFLSIDPENLPSADELQKLKLLMPEKWKLKDVVDMYKLASELDEQVCRSGSDEIDALRVLAEAGWVPGKVLDEAAEALDEIGSRIKQGLSFILSRTTNTLAQIAPLSSLRHFFCWKRVAKTAQNFVL